MGDLARGPFDADRVHPERAREAGDLAPDAADAEDEQRTVAQLVHHVALPAPLVLVAEQARQALREREQAEERELGERRRVDAGGRRDRHALELVRRELCGGDLLAGAGPDAVDPADPAVASPDRLAQDVGQASRLRAEEHDLGLLERRGCVEQLDPLVDPFDLCEKLRLERDRHRDGDAAHRTSASIPSTARSSASSTKRYGVAFRSWCTGPSSSSEPAAALSA